MAAAFLLVGIATIADSVASGKAAVSGVVVGVAALALGSIGAWRSLIAGVRYSLDGLEVRKLERTSRFSWCDVEDVDTRRTSGDVLFFIKQADIVLLLRSEKEEWLSPLAAYSFSSAIPKRVEARVDTLRAALDLHRAEHVNCARIGE